MALTKFKLDNLILLTREIPIIFSARESFSWPEMCDIEINLPPLTVRKKFIAVYNVLLENKKSYERGLDDLKIICDGYIDKLKRTAKKFSLGELHEEID